MTDWARFVRAKTEQAQRGSVPADANPDSRLPPGQHLVENFPVLDLGTRPRISAEQWRLRVFGLVEREVELDWPAFLALPQTRLTADFHCVTRWSRYDLEWQGVRAGEIIALAVPRPEAAFVTLHSHDDYTTNLPLAALLDDDVLFAHTVEGRPLSTEHGGPVRLVVPRRYGWKSAKWVRAVEVTAEDRPGFWEDRGYHNEADPWREERYRAQR